MKAFVFAWKHWDDYPPRTPRMIGLRVNPAGAALGAPRKVQAVWKMIPPARKVQPKVFISNIMCF